MSQGQLENFTGSSRNTIRRSLDRLTREGWIKMVEDYECARMSRRWKVIAPENHRKSGGAKSDTVQNEPGENLPPTRSKLDPSTGSKMNPYKERDPKEKSKNSLSKFLENYFTSLKPRRKRETEEEAFSELLEDFSEEQISNALDYLLKNGVPGSGMDCHSPMAYLTKAMKQILALMNVEVERRKKKADLEQRKHEEIQERKCMDEIESQSVKKREEAFLQAFPSIDDQENFFAEYAQRFPSLSLSGVLIRNLAMAAWWSEFQGSE